MLDVIFSAEASSDLEDAYSYGFDKFGEHQSDAYLGRLFQAVEQLAAQPHLGRARPELSVGVRSFVVQRHVIYYREQGQSLQIIRVLHGSRDVLLLLKDPQQTGFG